MIPLLVPLVLVESSFCLLFLLLIDSWLEGIAASSMGLDSIPCIWGRKDFEIVEFVRHKHVFCLRQPNFIHQLERETSIDVSISDSDFCDCGPLAFPLTLAFLRHGVGSAMLASGSEATKRGSPGGEAAKSGHTWPECHTDRPDLKVSTSPKWSSEKLSHADERSQWEMHPNALK